MALLRIDQLDVFYGEAQALNKVSLVVETGELIGVVGSNGAGKTTLLRAISRLITPASGKILFEDSELTHLQAHEVAHLGLAHVPEGRRLFASMSVYDNLLLGGLPQNKKKRMETLEEVYVLFPRLKERYKQAAGTLSGGEQQMVAIARAMMAVPKLLMLDEPSLGLSPLLVEETFSAIQRINAGGVTVLLVEQNIQECLSLAKRAYVLENGAVVMSGSGEDLLSSEQIRESYLGI